MRHPIRSVAGCTCCMCHCPAALKSSLHYSFSSFATSFIAGLFSWFQSNWCRDKVHLGGPGRNLSPVPDVMWCLNRFDSAESYRATSSEAHSRRRISAVQPEQNCSFSPHKCWDGSFLLTCVLCRAAFQSLLLLLNLPLLPDGVVMSRWCIQQKLLHFYVRLYELAGIERKIFS